MFLKCASCHSIREDLLFYYCTYFEILKFNSEYWSEVRNVLFSLMDNLFIVLPCSHWPQYIYKRQYRRSRLVFFLIIFSLEQICFMIRNWYMRCVEDNFRSSLCAGCVFGCCCYRYIGCFHSWLCRSVLLGKSRWRLVCS